MRRSGVPLVAGRAFTPRDRIGSEPVAIVSDALAGRLWPEGGAIGARVSIVDETEQGERQVRTVQVIGVVRDVRQTPEDDDLADMYCRCCSRQDDSAASMSRRSGAPLTWLPQLRSAFAEIDPEISFETPRTLQAAIAQQSSRPKFMAWLLGGSPPSRACSRSSV